MSATVESVHCAGDERLHIAPKVPGMGVSKFTFCLRKWKCHEPCREDSTFCPECLERWGQKEQQA